MNHKVKLTVRRLKHIRKLEVKEASMPTDCRKFNDEYQGVVVTFNTTSAKKGDGEAGVSIARNSGSGGVENNAQE
jgi:hypothetical protein